MLEEYAVYPSKQLERAIRKHRREIAKIEEALNDGQFPSLEKVLVNGCNIGYDVQTDAYPIDGGGAGAQGSGYAHNECGYTCEVYCYAYSRSAAGGITTTQTQSDPKTGTWVDSFASATTYGQAGCYSESYYYASCPALGISYSKSSTNYSCYTPFRGVTINGPANESVFGFNCKTLTWTTTLAGGAPPFSYAWSIDGIYMGGGSSLSKQLCGGNSSSSQTLYLHVDVTDATGVTRSDDHTTTFQSYEKPAFEGPCGGSPCVR
jgi:hypothetical protein